MEFEEDKGAFRKKSKGEKLVEEERSEKLDEVAKEEKKSSVVIWVPKILDLQRQFQLLSQVASSLASLFEI